MFAAACTLMMSACTPKKLTFLRSKVKEEKTEVKEKNDIIYLKKKKKGEKKLAFIQWKWFHLHAAAALVNS